MESYYISMFLISLFFFPPSFSLLLLRMRKALFMVEAAEGGRAFLSEKCF